MRKVPIVVLAGVVVSTRAFAPPSSSSSSSSSFSRSSILPEKNPTGPLSVTQVHVNGDKSDTSTSKQEDYLWQLRLNVFEKAKTVATVCTSGTLCTVSNHEGIEGSPFGSFVDYVLDNHGNPVLLMNEMSMHTINIQQNALKGDGPFSNLVTLFVQNDGGNSNGKKGQDLGRCSFTCKVEKIPSNAQDLDIIRMRYSLTHAYADQVMDSPKFAFYRLIPEKIYYVGGFGVMAKWVDVEDYKTAAPDILAKEANDIVKKLNREYMEDLQLMARHLLGVTNEIEEIRVTNVDRLGMDVRVTCQQGTRRNKLSTDEFRVGFRIPVISIEDAKSEVLKVFQEAWEKDKLITWGDEEEPGSQIPIMKIAADSLE